MDKTGEREKLENERAEIEQYLDHPISREIISDNREKQDEMVRVLCNINVTDIESFFRHFTAVGVLKGLRQHQAIIDGNLQEIKRRIEEL